MSATFPTPSHLCVCVCVCVCVCESERERERDGGGGGGSSELRTLLHNLVSWCFEPSQPQRITSGLIITQGFGFQAETDRQTNR